MRAIVFYGWGVTGASSGQGLRDRVFAEVLDRARGRQEFVGRHVPKEFDVRQREFPSGERAGLIEHDRV